MLSIRPTAEHVVVRLRWWIPHEEFPVLLQEIFRSCSAERAVVPAVWYNLIRWQGKLPLQQARCCHGIRILKYEQKLRFLILKIKLTSSQDKVDNNIRIFDFVVESIGRFIPNIPSYLISHTQTYNTFPKYDTYLPSIA